jgi:undecaprenyl-diphosphatase
MLHGLDLQLFEWINGAWSSDLLDAILVPLRNKYVWIPVYVFIIAFLLTNFRRRGYYLVIFLMITVGLADFVSNTGFKKNFERPRPCHVMQDVNLKVRCGSGYSFTSNHAANHFALSTFLLLLVGRRHRYLQIGLLVWATSIAIAQVYVGVHYPTDVLAGGILGYLIARLTHYLYRRLEQSGFSPS